MEELNELMGLIGVGFIFAWSVLVYLIGLYPKCYMFKEAGIDTWMAFIPILNEAMTLKLIGWSPWVYLGLLFIGIIPIVGGLALCVINAVLCWEISNNFGLGTLGKVLSIFFWPIVSWYIALTKKNYFAM